MSQSSWLVGGMLPGIERQHKKLEPSPERLLAVLHRWRDEAVKVCLSTKRDPANRPAQDVVISYRFAFEVGSKSAPIGTLSCIDFFTPGQKDRAESGRVPIRC
jgi:hypothetical protein